MAEWPVRVAVSLAGHIGLVVVLGWMMAPTPRPVFLDTPILVFLTQGGDGSSDGASDGMAPEPAAMSADSLAPLPPDAPALPEPVAPASSTAEVIVPGPADNSAPVLADVSLVPEPVPPAIPAPQPVVFTPPPETPPAPRPSRRPASPHPPQPSRLPATAMAAPTGGVVGQRIGQENGGGVSNELPGGQTGTMAGAGGGDTPSRIPDPPRPAVSSDPGAVALYLTAVRKRIQAALVYPLAAKRLGHAGTVMVRLRVRADGSLDPAPITILSGSGSRFLDDGAVQAVRDAAPFPPPPLSDLTLELPVLFSLERG